MIVILARSPYILTIDEPTQIAAKVEIYLWHKGDSEPISPNYTLEKNIRGDADRKLYFNVSPYILEKINNVYPNQNGEYGSGDSNPYGNAIYPLPNEEEPTAWCFVKIITYYKETTSWITLNDVTYVGVNGWGAYTQGFNYTPDMDLFLDQKIVHLADNRQVLKLKNYYGTNVGTYKYFNVLIEHDGTNETKVRYIKYEGAPGTMRHDEVILNDTDDAGIYNFKIPYQVCFDNLYDGNLVYLMTDLSAEEMPVFQVETPCETKYEPVECSFINKLGGWSFITFFKAKTNSYNVESKEYSFLQDIPYSTFVGEKKSFNYDLRENIKVNTGFIEENYENVIKELMVSDTILLDFKPVTIKTKSMQVKTSLRDKVINYEIEFEYNFNLMNDMI